MHSHSDLQLLTAPDHLVKVSQGVTTEVLGQDGLSYAPVDDATVVCPRDLRTPRGCTRAPTNWSRCVRWFVHGADTSARTHRSYGAGALEAFAEMVDVSRRAGCPLHLAHTTMNFSVNRGRAPELLDLLDTAIADGCDISLDSYPYLASDLVSTLRRLWR
jgi:N-acyl-D-aspartate/D-glutamate deacylase